MGMVRAASKQEEGLIWDLGESHGALTPAGNSRRELRAQACKRRDDIYVKIRGSWRWLG